MEFTVTFFTHLDGIKYDRFLKENSIKGVLRPTPRVLSSSCGVCMFFTLEDELSKDYTDFEIKERFLRDGCDKIFIASDNTYRLIASNE